MKGIESNKQAAAAAVYGKSFSPYLLAEVIRRDGAIYNREFRYADEWVFEELSFDENNRAEKYTLFLKQPLTEKEQFAEYEHATRIADLISCQTRFTCAMRAHILDFQLLKLPDWLGKAFGTSSTIAKAKISEFIVRRESHSFSYGILFEVCSPFHHLPEISKLDQWQVALPSRELFKAAFTKGDSWVSLAHSELRSDLAQRYPELFTHLRQRLFEIMKDALPVLLTY